MTALVRIVPDPMQPTYARHKHEGMIICPDHLQQLRYYQLSPELCGALEQLSPNERIAVDLILERDYQIGGEEPTFVQLVSDKLRRGYLVTIAQRLRVSGAVSNEPDPPFVDLPAAQVALFSHRCLMCGVEPSPGRTCASEDCGAPLHPQWPAVYCCNGCALGDV
jgi:hypothetical protein